MDEQKLLNSFKNTFLNKKVINVTTIRTEEGISVVLLFENGYRLNYTYDEKFLELGKKLRNLVLERDLKEILKNNK